MRKNLKRRRRMKLIQDRDAILPSEEGAQIHPRLSSSHAPDGRIGRPKGTGPQRIYSQVREDIVALRIPPGADLDEATLERRFGVSRTPVREALIRLASEGLIRLLPNRGARVSEIDISEIPRLFEALDLCQRATIRWAALRRSAEHIAALQQANQGFLLAAEKGNHEQMGEHNKEFHTIIARACGNPYFESLYTSLLAVSLRLARIVFAYAPMNGEPVKVYYREIVRQHEDMIRAIEDKDVERADTLARLHTDLFRDRITRYVNATSERSILLDSIA